MEQQNREPTMDQKCWRCGKALLPGHLTYVAQIRVFAGFDGVLIEPEGGVDRHLKKLLQEIHRENPEELEKEVYEEFALVLCKSCRDRFVEEIEHPWVGPFQIPGGPDRFVH